MSGPPWFRWREQTGPAPIGHIGLLHCDELAVWDGHTAMVAVGNGMMIEAGDPGVAITYPNPQRGAGISRVLATTYRLRTRALHQNRGAFRTGAVLIPARLVPCGSTDRVKDIGDNVNVVHGFAFGAQSA